MSFDFKKSISWFIGLTPMAILVIAQLLWLRQIHSASSQTANDLASRTEQVQALLASNKVALNAANVNHFKELYTDTQKKYGHLLLLLDTATSPQQNLTPLEFKEEYLKTQTLLTERAGLWNIPLPKAMGFDEFEGGNIPTPENVPSLSLQLDALRTLVNFMIESRVTEIIQIKKQEAQSLSLDAPDAKEIMYTALSFEFRFRGNLESLQTLLHKLYSSTHFFIVRQMDIQADDPETLSITLHLDAIKLKRDKENI